MRADKLDRYRTTKTAVGTMDADVPFWVTLTPRERRVMTPNELRAFHLRRGPDRKAFRDYIRSLCR